MKIEVFAHHFIVPDCCLSFPPVHTHAIAASFPKAFTVSKEDYLVH